MRRRGTKRRAALIDDDPDFQAVIREWLIPEFETLSFSDGEELIGALDEIDPDVFIMDIGLPGPTGISLCMLLRQDRRFAKTPILFLTGYRSESVFHECLLAGGTEFLSKPLEPKKLIAAVRRLTRPAVELPEREDLERVP